MAPYAMTIRELATHAGVSRTTVSRALNNAPDVSQATRDRIQKLAVELGYQSNPMVTALMSSVRQRRVKEDRTVLAIVPPPFQEIKWGTGHYAHKLYRRGVEQRAARLGFQVEDFMVQDCGHSYKRLSQILYQRGIQAVLIPSIDSRQHPEHYEYDLDWNKFFVAGIGFSVTKAKNADRAVMSHFGSALLALEEIKKQGYERIGFGARKWINDRSEGRWLAAYMIFQRNNPHLPVLPAFEFEIGENEHRGLERWMKKNRPEAILGERYFMQLMGELEIRFPEDVSFALMDLLPGYPDSVNLAGVDQRFESVGAATVDLIAGKINRGERGLSREPHVLKVLGKWVEGPSLPSRNE